MGDVQRLEPCAVPGRRNKSGVSGHIRKDHRHARAAHHAASVEIHLLMRLAQHCTALHSTALHKAQPCTAQPCTKHSTALLTVLHCTALYCTALVGRTPWSAAGPLAGLSVVSVVI